MESCLYEGRVRHRRTHPIAHEFEYRIFMVLLDLDELDEAFRGRLLWSARGPNVAWFRRADHYGDPNVPLKRSIHRLVQEETGRRLTGPVRILTHFRYFGYVMNPVSFYYCYDTNERLDTVVAEVHNTPWGERHMYVLCSAAEGAPNTSSHRHHFAKAFHVSPFMSMDQEYTWSFSEPAEKLAVHMDNLERREKIFDATLTMDRRPLTGPSLARCLTRYPLQTVQVVAGIYWQALLLWIKKCPVFAHPYALEAKRR